MIFSDPIAKLSFATIEDYYMLIWLWIQCTLAANIFTIAIEKQAQFRHKVNLFIKMAAAPPLFPNSIASPCSSMQTIP